MKNPKTYLIVIPIYKGVDIMDVASAKEVFSWAKNALDGRKVKVLLVAKNKKSVRTRDKMQIIPHATFKDRRVQQPDIIWIPGGSITALSRLLNKPSGKFMTYITAAASTAKYACSVCEGALLFAKTGLLNGHKATTHWKFYPCLCSFKGVDVVQDYPRYVHSGNKITGGGISSGLDQAFYVTSLFAGTEVAAQAALVMQYAPQVEFPICITPATTCPVTSI